MAIGSEIDFLAGIDFQAANLWDFILLDDINLNNPLQALTSLVSLPLGFFNKFKVTTTSIPFPSLENVSLKTGHKPYTARVWEEDFSMTVMEDTSFSSYNYFNLWFSQIYDFTNNVFKLHPPTKTGILTYYGGDLITPTAIFFYEKVRLLGIETINVDRTNSNPLNLTINLSFERLVSVPIVGAINNLTKSAVGFLQSL